MGQIRDSKLLRKIALTIKELREEKGVSQEEVYNDINITSEELKRHEQM
jgi:DNA-binding transcriptional regulator YiaG